MDDEQAAREKMVEEQILARGVQDQRVLQAMRTIPREAFVPQALRPRAYLDTPLPIEAGQTISQPYMVALMAEAAAIQETERVLEIGTGSGYGAAVLGQLAWRVYSIERHAPLAEAARRRLRRLALGHVAVRTGDGTLGWPEEAPFDAIIVTAGVPRLPATWLGQLAVGGRLVVPVGGETRRQQLVRVHRLSENDYREEELLPVQFVPMIGAHAWREEDDVPVSSPPGEQTGPVPCLRQAALPLPQPEATGFADFAERFAHCRVVLLGEPSHGSSEFYRARSAITRHLIQRHGFNAVAVEADWPDTAQLHRYVLHQPREDRPPPFRRFPDWLWRNREMSAFVSWLRHYNEGRDEARQVGIHGLDLFNLNDAMHEVIEYLDRRDPPLAELARERYGCLMPWRTHPVAYGRAVAHERYRNCEEDVVEQLLRLLSMRLEDAARQSLPTFDARQNAHLVVAAERYYRRLFHGEQEAWNLRDTHMFDTLQRVLKFYGAEARVVVWAHNAHVGDARATERGRDQGEITLGQLCRSRYGEQTWLLGGGTATGRVAAARQWGAPVQRMALREPLPDSLEWLAWQTGLEAFFVEFGKAAQPQLHQALAAPRLQRLIGAVYRPRSERLSHYLLASAARQYDGYLWFRDTTALAPLAVAAEPGEPDTWPFGE